MSSNLPSRAYNLGYRLEGNLGTIGDLYLSRDGRLIEVWRYPRRAPNIFEMEELIEGWEEFGK